MKIRRFLVGGLLTATLAAGALVGIGASPASAKPACTAAYQTYLVDHYNEYEELYLYYSERVEWDYSHPDDGGWDRLGGDTTLKLDYQQLSNDYFNSLMGYYANCPSY